MSGYIGNIPTPQATQTRETFTATASQTTFNTAGYTPGFVDVWLNGVKLVNGDDFTATNGSDVVLTVGAASGDTVEVLSFSTFEVNSQTFTGDTSAVNLNVTGTFTSRGIDDNATSTAMTLDASGNLLVGGTGTAPDTSSTDTGHAFRADGRAGISRDGGPALSINRLTSDGAIQEFRKNGTTVGSIGTNGGNPYFASTSVGLKLTTEVLPVDNNGASADGFLDLGGPSDRFNNLYLSGGVYLGGTGAANKLDDYEEGTWTPTIGGDTNPTVSYSQQYGYYTKIGRMVYVSMRVRASSYSGGSGSLKINGLPFTPASGPQHNIGGTFSSSVSWGTGNTQLSPWAVDGQAVIRFRGLQNNAGNYDLLVSDYSANDYLDVNGWYFV